MTHTLAHELKAAGFPQPSPMAGQWWYDKEGMEWLIRYFIDCECDVAVCLDKDRWEHLDEIILLTFAPCLDDIAPLLPPTFALELWDGKPSCTNRDEANPIRTFGDTFAEAAARMWLEIKKQGI